jgi:DNA-binding MarR family transcriptional regulator
MTGPDENDMLGSLVDLAEAIQTLNATIRKEADTRTGQALLTDHEVSLLAHALRNPDWTLEASANALGQSLTSIRRIARSLECRGLLVSTGQGHRGASITYRATPAGVALRDAARERSAQHLRYALAGLTADQVGVLRRAAPGIAGLTASLGFREVHASYLTAEGEQCSSHHH